MNRIALVATCLAALVLAGCGDDKKPMTVRDKSNVKPIEVGGDSSKAMQEGSDPGTTSKP